MPFSLRALPMTACVCVLVAGAGLPTSVAAKSRDTRQAVAEQQAPARGKVQQGIVVLVNDDPVTAYEIEQRANFLAANAGGTSADMKTKAEARWRQITKDPRTNQRLQKLFREKGVKTREEATVVQREFAKNLQREMFEQLKREARTGRVAHFKKQAQEELIEERLKLQEAKRLGVEFSDAQVDTIMKNLAERNKMTPAQFAEHLKRSGIDPQTMRERFRASYGWRDAIRRRFGAQISVSRRDVDRVIADTASESGDDAMELQLLKITLPMPSHIDQTALAKRFAEAEAMRHKAKNCQAMAGLAKTISDARFEDLKAVKPGSIPEPTRSMLLAAKDGDILPPTTAPSGIEVYAVCGRRVNKGDDKQREKATQELQAREFEMLATRHLRDLKQDAHIEYR